MRVLVPWAVLVVASGCPRRSNETTQLKAAPVDTPTCPDAFRRAHQSAIIQVSSPSRSCTSDMDCNDGTAPPPCAGEYGNFCACPKLKSNKCKNDSGRCIYRVDSENQSCVCIPGYRVPCGDGGVAACNDAGTAWSGCS